jgi:hypothetical protein
MRTKEESDPGALGTVSCATQATSTGPAQTRTQSR